MAIGIAPGGASQSQFILPREMLLELELEMDALCVRSRRCRAAVVTLATAMARQWSHPDRMNGWFAMARESKRGRNEPRFYSALGLTETLFRSALEILMKVEFFKRVERDDSSKWRWTAWGVRQKPYQYCFAGKWRAMLDQAWAAFIERGLMTPAQRLFKALQRRKKLLAEQNLRNTELRSKGLSTIPEVRNFVAPRGSPPTPISAFNLAAAGRGPGLEGAIEEERR